MRIAIDARAYFQRTGIARYTRGLVGALGAWASSDAFLVLISDRHDTAELPLPPHMTVQVSRAQWLDAHGEAEQLDREAQAWGAELFHAIFPPLAVATVPTVATVFDVTPFTHPDVHQPLVRDAFTSAWKRARQHRARLVAVSRATRDALRPWTDADADAAVIGIGLSTPFDAPLPAGWEAHPRQGVLCVGTLEPRKNVHVAVDAVRRLAARGLHAPLTIVGKNGWSDVPAALGNAPGVEFMGFVTDEELLALYRNAAVLVCPSRDEGFGLPVLEAMAQGVLPLVSPASALAELVDDARLVAEPRGDAFATAIGWWLQHPAARAAASSRLQRRARQYTWEDVAARWVGEYRACLA